MKLFNSFKLHMRDIYCCTSRSEKEIMTKLLLQMYNFVINFNLLLLLISNLIALLLQYKQIKFYFGIIFMT